MSCQTLKKAQIFETIQHWKYKHCYIFCNSDFLLRTHNFYTLDYSSLILSRVECSLSMLLVLTKGVSIVQGNDWKVWENSPFNCSQKVRLEWGLIVPKRLESWFLFDPTTFPIMWCASAVLLAGHVSRGKNDSRNIKSKSSPFLDLYELVFTHRENCTHSVW